MTQPAQPALKNPPNQTSGHLAEDLPDVAETSTFERDDWTLFSNLGSLGQKAGVPLDRLRALVVKELADNALDAAGACEVGRCSDDGYFVQDEGSGLDPARVAALFSIRRPLTSSKLLRLPTRGALGNGLRVVTGAVLASGGTLRVFTRNTKLDLFPQDDGTTRAVAKQADWPVGTRIEVKLGTSIPAHGVPALSWAQAAVELAAGGSPYKGKTSPWWYDSDSFFELLQAIRGCASARELVDRHLDGCSGAKAGKVTAAFKGRAPGTLSRQEAEALLAAARKQARPVNPNRLGRVGAEVFPGTGYAYETGEIKASPGTGKLHAHVPFVVEVWADAAASDDAQVCINRTPVTGDIHYWRDDKHKNRLVLYGCNLSNCHPAVGRADVFLRVNVTAPYVPITTDGKEPNLAPFQQAIMAAARAAARRLKRKTPQASKSTQRRMIRNHIDEAAAKAGGGGDFRFSLRQLYYAVRPFVMDELGIEPDYGYFTQVITDIEAERGGLPGLYRDPRGVLYHPHTGEEIPLGTLAVEQYERPAWTFNKVLYAEKEGFFSILRSVRWPERHDCALLTSKGFASRAARDVLDLLGDSGEEVLFFCIHDADAAGTLIYETLQEGTKARPGRRTHVINLGLEPWEALDLDLPLEKVKRSKSHRPVARYVRDRDDGGYWAEWLQIHRVELNAMTTPEFVDWLDEKIAPYAGKVVPPEQVLAERLEQKATTAIREHLSERILREARLEDRVHEAWTDAQEQVWEVDLPDLVRCGLDQKPAAHWTVPIDELAQQVAESCEPVGPILSHHLWWTPDDRHPASPKEAA